MRRAIRHGKRLGLEQAVPRRRVRRGDRGDGRRPTRRLRENRAVHREGRAARRRSRFRRTLDRGLAILDEEIARLGRDAASEVLPGKVAFQLYDTFGFPMDLTRVIAAERGFDVDEAGFDRDMAEQRARSEWKGSGEQAVGDLHKQIASELGETHFLGYEAPAAKARGEGAPRERRARRRRRAQGDRVEVVTAATPFYGESGGQVGDRGTHRRAAAAASR